MPFKFIVEGKPFYVHNDVVSLHSKPLDRMMNGYMEEAHKGSATLKDLDADTFVRFIEWAYKGYYTAADFTTVVQDGSDSADRYTEDKRVAEKPLQRTKIPDMEDDLKPRPDQAILHIAESHGLGDHGSVSPEKRVVFPDQNTPTARPDTMPPPPPPVKRRNTIEIPRPRRNRNPNDVYSNVFLSHARLFVFAQKYDIQALKMLAHDELYVTLAVYTLYANRTADITDLLNYVYCNTSEQGGDEKDLRTMVMEYVRREIHTLESAKDFRDFMIADEGAPAALVDDFMTMIRERIPQDGKDLLRRQSRRHREREKQSQPPFLP